MSRGLVSMKAAVPTKCHSKPIDFRTPYYPQCQTKIPTRHSMWNSQEPFKQSLVVVSWVNAVQSPHPLLSARSHQMYDRVIPIAFCARLYRLSWAIDPHCLSLIYADLVILLALWPDQNTVTYRYRNANDGELFEIPQWFLFDTIDVVGMEL